MSLVKRAGLYTIRQKQKSILLFLILILVSTLVLTGISIQSAVSSTFNNMHRNIAGTINLERNTPEFDEEALMEAMNDGIEASNQEFMRQMNSGDYVTFDMLETIMSLSGIRGYNITAEYMMRDVMNENFEFLADNEVSTTNRDGDIVQTHNASIQSATSTEQMVGFHNGNLRLVDGRHLIADDYRKVMISEQLAEYNNLDIGDTLNISGAPTFLGAHEVSSKTFEFEIIGIYTGTRALEEDEVGEHIITDPLVLDADTLIIDMATFMEEYERTDFFGTGVADSLPGPLSIFIEDPNEIENIYDEISNLSEIYGKNFSLTMGTEAFEDVISSLGSLQALVLMLIVIIALVSMAILGILLTIWTRGRVKEIGIYLANGIKKGEILTQFILEAIFIAVIAFAFSMPISQVIADGTGNFILTQFASAEALRNEQLEGSEFQDLSSGGFQLVLPETGFMDEADIANTLEMVEVGVSGHDLMWVYVIGLPVLMSSVLIAGYPVAKLKPKEILSKMS